ncbi:hypothetical protein E2K93_02785 [Thalassotalea sp. HSM 43]|uniref:putative Ig domain-containing protein n=1 Tax=Thalassotalea sp. HSM 43 TaxID=2552945 RepID=UPI001080D222|nr:putative Ig domain-containing protein [Thalassotalea sp. HSM 43]QBY03361.1 hypothetical protein E2K93_02785 [Thalassotalea sp. HSM 43]
MSKNLNKSYLALLVASALSLTACGGGGGGGGTEKKEIEPPTNNAPTISGSPSLSINENQSYSFSANGADSDGDALTYSIANMPQWAAFDSATGTLTGTPGNADVGTFTGITISVSDGTDSSSLSPFDIIVNDIFALQGSATLEVTVGETNVFTPTLVDHVDADFSYSIDGAPSFAGFSFDAATGQVSVTPAADDIGSFNITITASNGVNSASHNMTLTISPGSISVAGKVIDGYISGAHVFLDVNNNMMFDDNEPNALSNNAGEFTLDVPGTLIDSIPTSTLVAELGSGQGVDADDMSRFDDDFAARPIKMMSYPIRDLTNMSNGLTAYITPFTHLIHEEILSAAGGDLSLITDQELYNLIKDSAVDRINGLYSVDLDLATSDFFAAEVPINSRNDIASVAKAVLNDLQDQVNDSDQDGFVNAEDDLPFNSEYISDIDQDGLGDCVRTIPGKSCVEEDDDIDGDNITNADDPEPTVPAGLAVFKPVPEMNVPGYEMCVGLVNQDKVLCLDNYQWSILDSIKGEPLPIDTNSIVKSGDSAAAVGTCAVANNEVYCLDGKMRFDFAGENPVSLNPIALEMGYLSMCYLDQTGVKCFGGIEESMPESLVNASALALTSGNACAISEVTDNEQTSTAVSCWGSDSYGLTTGVPVLSNPTQLFSNMTTICALDDTGIKCWGNPDYNLDKVDHASTKLSNIHLTGDSLCFIDEQTPVCYGNSDQPTPISADKDYFDADSGELIVAHGEFIAPFEEQLTKYVEGVHQQRVLLPEVDFEQGQTATEVFRLRNYTKNTCLISDGEISCDSQRYCGLDNGEWQCQTVEFNFDDIDFEVKTQINNSNTVCAIGALKAHCVGAGFNGEIKLN